MDLLDPRRHAPRVSVDGLCGVVSGRELRHASLVDVSAIGLRIELPFDPATASATVQLEIEVPAIDEVMWARGHVTYAHLAPMGGVHSDGQPRLWCRAGLHIEMARRDRWLLRDYVVETRRARWRATRAAQQLYA